MLDDKMKGSMSAKQASEVLGLDERRIQQLATEGYIDRIERGRYRSLSVIQGYIRFLREEKRTSSQSAAESRVKDARAAEIEQRTAIRANELIEVDEAEAVVDEIAGMLKSEFDGFAARLTRDVVMRRKIEAGIDEIFGKAATRIAKEIASLRASGAALDPDAA